MTDEIVESNGTSGTINPDEFLNDPIHNLSTILLLSKELWSEEFLYKLIKFVESCPDQTKNVFSSFIDGRGDFYLMTKIKLPPEMESIKKLIPEQLNDVTAGMIGHLIQELWNRAEGK